MVTPMGEVGREPVRIEVRGPLGHPVAIARGLLAAAPAELRRVGLEPPRRALLVADSAVVAAAEIVRSALDGAGTRAALLALEATEDRKDPRAVAAIWSAALAAGIGRRDAIVSVGGGLVGDVAGFAAATFLRGVAHVAIPTTLLAMVDASTGGKTGINLPLPDGGPGKNLAGAFHPPRLVLVDPSTLASLPDREYRSGLAECVKHALLAGEAELAGLERDAAAIAARDPATVDRLIAANIAFKASVVERDPYERNERALLNLGHTFGHALETTPGLVLTHGEAVALGLVAAAAAGDGPRLAGRIAAITGGFGLPVRLSGPLDRDAFDLRIGVDKKADAAGPRLVLPRGPGRVEVVAATTEAIDAGLSAISPR